MKNSIVRDKSYMFALEVISVYKIVVHNHKDYVLSKQLLRSGTAIGALIREADQAQSKADFINKMSIALKEANETEYWLLLLRDSELIDEDIFTHNHKKCDEIIRLLVSIVKTSKENLKK
ncbi:four helix bundle protein [Bacteroidales bacterium OttesenSCG-928-K03]|nr:four helix bundle protein [Odoribacter sp. OttesenSCG-928-L07]MDL2239227.1 four helix bundle protein [Bacteroidales bacterium OttesenSCG-928-L14]MDL2240059.1 four helix bundle protein [Bacteroidales bacterium OttesenSCG-928-K22]MDL2242338.1 four helix bundle protein [Bacteroidales bacterium OttesenSCG-928-K03]